MAEFKSDGSYDNPVLEPTSTPTPTELKSDGSYANPILGAVEGKLEDQQMMDTPSPTSAPDDAIGDYFEQRTFSGAQKQEQMKNIPLTMPEQMMNKFDIPEKMEAYEA